MARKSRNASVVKPVLEVMPVLVEESCGSCGAEPGPKKPLRRGKCARCYASWLAEKPIGIGACCSSCGERRRKTLRHFELAQTFIVLCQNCSARAEALSPQPRSVEGLRMRLLRDRRWGDRRAESVSGVRQRYGAERRDNDRRTSERNVFDATDLVIEITAETAEEDGTMEPDGPITGIHRLVDREDL